MRNVMRNMMHNIKAKEQKPRITALAVAAAMLALTAATACGCSAGGSGGSLGEVAVWAPASQSSTSGDARQQQQQPQQPDDGNAAPAILDVWVNDPKNSMEKAGEWLEFKNDGTYRFHHHFQAWSYIGTIATLQVAGDVTETGDYVVQGDTLRCTNIKRSIEITGGIPEKGFIQTDKPVSDIDRPYRYGPCPEIGPGSQYLNLGLTWLYIDMRHPDEMMTVGDMNFEIVQRESQLVKSVGFDDLREILGWPEALPEVLYPTGYGGVVTHSSVSDMKTTAADDLANHRHTKFDVEVNTDKESLLPYFDYLASNGFTKYIGIYHKSLMIDGFRYEIEVDYAVGLYVGISFSLRQEDTPSYFWDEEWDS